MGAHYLSKDSSYFTDFILCYAVHLPMSTLSAAHPVCSIHSAYFLHAHAPSADGFPFLSAYVVKFAPPWFAHLLQPLSFPLSPLWFADSTLTS